LRASESWEFYLCRSVGNSFYFASELVAQAGVIELVKSQRPASTATSDLSMDAQAFAALCNTIVGISGQITELFGELIASLVAKSKGDNLEVAVARVEPAEGLIQGPYGGVPAHSQSLPSVVAQMPASMAVPAPTAHYVRPVVRPSSIKQDGALC
jgi:hypothetical protein